MSWSIIRARLRKFIAVLKDFGVIEVRKDYLRIQITEMVTVCEPDGLDEHQRNVKLATNHEGSPIV